MPTPEDFDVNGNTMTLALSREPGRATWITRRDYEFNSTPLYWHRTVYDAEGRPIEAEDGDNLYLLCCNNISHCPCRGILIQ